METPAPAGRDAGGGNGADTADGDLVLLRLPHRTNLAKPLDVHAVGEPHHHRPAVIQSSGLSSVPRMRVPRFLWANLQTAGVVSGGECRVPPPGDVVRWRSGLLEQSYVRVHPQKLAPRLASRRDVPTHYCYGQCILRSFVRILPHVLCGSLPAGTGQMLLVVLVREVGDDVKMV